MDKQWFVLKTRNYNVQKVKSCFVDNDIAHFIPFRKSIECVNGKKITKDKPLALNYIFVNLTLRELDELLADYPYIYMVYSISDKKPLIVPDVQMRDFIRLYEFSEDAMFIDNSNLKKGDKVRIIKGSFMGITGELIRIKGHKRVVVRMEGPFSLAVKTYLPASFIEHLTT